MTQSDVTHKKANYVISKDNFENMVLISVINKSHM